MGYTKLCVCLLFAYYVMITEAKIVCFDKFLETDIEGACTKLRPYKIEYVDEEKPEYCCSKSQYSAFYNKTTTFKVDGKRYYRCISCKELYKDEVVMWENWSPWSSCNVACNETEGYRIRTRACNSTHNPCDGHDYEMQENCTLPYESCGECWEDWTTWDRWSECSTTCGEGEKTREMSRETSFREITDQRMVACETVLTKVEKCPYRHCNIDGGWSKWSDWSTECVSDGRDAYRYRFRSCSDPKPMGTGSACANSSDEYQKC